MDRRSGRGFILLAAVLGVAPSASARSCKIERVAGTYGYTPSGTIPTLGAVAAVGRISLDAAGNLTGTQTSSFNGSILQETLLSGTYAVNADCTATVNVYQDGVLARTTSIAVVYENNERELRAIFLTSGTVLTVNGRNLFDEEED